MAAAALDLVADIGGTNARFALVDPASERPLLRAQCTLGCADFRDLRHAAEHYLAQVDTRPARAAIAVAATVRADGIRLTNRAWSFSQRELREALGLRQLTVLNDFAALAWAVPALARDESEALHGDPAAPLAGPVSVLGPGTGLGVSLLLGDPGRGWQVVATEGGHASFAPIDDEDRLLARWLDARFGRTSNERLLSGPGLAQIDAALRAGGATPVLDAPDPGLRDPAAIVAAALAGHDASASRSLARFCAVLGSVAGDCALLHGARTVMIAGGMVPRFIPFLRASEFRRRFLAKGRYAAMLQDVAVRVITHPAPGLLGAAVALRHAGEPGA
jgi:glucokinase